MQHTAPTKRARNVHLHAAWLLSLILVLAAPLLILGMGLHGVRNGVVAAPPCPDIVPPPTTPDNGLPTLPSTGGGGGEDSFCRDHPSDPSCAGVGLKPGPPHASNRREAVSIPSARTGAMALFTLALISAVAPPPCDDVIPAPTPVPLIPVDAPREAPGVAATLEIPQVQVRMNPEPGLVNVPTWLWAEGYRGQDLSTSRSWSPPYEPTTIQVRYTFRRALWNFGDGGQIEGRSLGQPYPQQSDVRNAYGWSSRTEPGGLFRLALTIEWAVEYRVNGGPAQPLPAVQRRYEAVYPVQQLQPIITNP